MKQRIFLVVSFILFFSEFAIAGVPVPWGSKLIQDNTAVTNDGEERRMLSYENNASNQDLFNYYLKEMPAQGYKLFMNGEQNLIFSKGENTVVIFISPFADGKTRFMVGTSSTKSINNKADASEAIVKCEPIPSVPLYPGARCMRSMYQKSGGSAMASYSTNDSVDMVLNFYRSHLPQYSWRMEKEVAIQDIVSRAMQEQNQGAMMPEQEDALHDFYGNARGLSFSNNQGDSCSIQVMNNPTRRSKSLINVIYEEKASK